MQRRNHIYEEIISVWDNWDRGGNNSSFLPHDTEAYKLKLHLVSCFHSDPELTYGFLSLSIAQQW